MFEVFQTEKRVLPAWAAASRSLLRRLSRGGLAGSPTCSAEVSANPVGLVSDKNLPFFSCRSQFRSAPVGLSLLQRLHTAFHQKKPPGRATRALGLKMFGLLHKPIIPAKPPPNQGWAGENRCIWVFIAAQWLNSLFTVSKLPQKLLVGHLQDEKGVYRRKNLDLLNHNYPIWISKDIWRRRCLSLHCVTRALPPFFCCFLYLQNRNKRNKICISFARLVWIWPFSAGSHIQMPTICAHPQTHTRTSDGVDSNTLHGLPVRPFYLKHNLVLKGGTFCQQCVCVPCAGPVNFKGPWYILVGSDVEMLLGDHVSGLKALCHLEIIQTS